MATINILFFFSAGTVFIRQNLTSTDVSFWSIKTVPALKGLTNSTGVIDWFWEESFVVTCQSRELSIISLQEAECVWSNELFIIPLLGKSGIAGSNLRVLLPFTWRGIYMCTSCHRMSWSQETRAAEQSRHSHWAINSQRKGQGLTSLKYMYALISLANHPCLSCYGPCHSSKGMIH